MYLEKIEGILKDIEDKDLEIAGGSVVGINLAIVNSLVIYIANLTIGKKKYIDVQENVNEILHEAEKLKKEALESIDKDKEILEEILATYKIRKQSPKDYEKACKEAVQFALQVLEIALKTSEISKEIANVGNKMLESDFNICKLYSIASVESSKENLFVNLNSIEDEKYKTKMNREYKKMLQKYHYLHY